MTTTNIPPCPVCGVVPIVVPPSLHNSCFDMLEVCDCFGYDCEISTHNWTDRCNQELGRACRELGIETAEQLKARLAPDPRVALLEKSREVCEYTEVGTKIVGCVELPYYDEPEYCPSCGRKVVVK